MKTYPDGAPATAVLFRVWDGELIALFPRIAGDTNDPHTCQSYQRVGQHGAADLRGIMARSRPATPAEYKPLQEELEGRGYVLDIRQRTPSNALAQRRAELAQ